MKINYFRHCERHASRGAKQSPRCVGIAHLHLRACASVVGSSTLLATTRTCPLFFMIFGSFANAATTRPINCGDSELLISKCLAFFIMLSVRTKPGYNETTATLYLLNSC